MTTGISTKLREGRSRWFSSFYWRIGLSFVVFVIVVLVAQSIMVSYLAARSDGSFRPPNAVATTIAAEVGALLAREPDAEPGQVLRKYRDEFPDAYVVLKGGRIFATTTRPLPEDIRQEAEAVLDGAAPRQTPSGSRTTGPVVSAPIQVANELRGMVVMPPPPRRGMLQDIGAGDAA